MSVTALPKPNLVLPLIDADGAIGELVVSQPLADSYQRTRTDSAGIIHTDRLSHKSFKFGVADQMAVVYIFVHDEFLSGLNAEARNETLCKFVKEQSAWFFTYGHREKNTK